MNKKRIEYRRKYQRERCRRIRFAYLSDKKCVICFSKKRLEIDHIDREKKTSHNIWSWSNLRREEELKKCQVLCHDCHLKKTRSEIMKEHCYNAYVTKRCLCTLCFSFYRKVCDNYNELRRIKRAKEKLKKSS